MFLGQNFYQFRRWFMCINNNIDKNVYTSLMKIYQEYPKISIHQSGKCDYYYPICTHKSKVLYTIGKFSKFRYWKWTHILHLWHIQIKIVRKAKSEINFSCLCIKIDFSKFQGQHKEMMCDPHWNSLIMNQSLSWKLCWNQGNHKGLSGSMWLNGRFIMQLNHLGFRNQIWNMPKKPLKPSTTNWQKTKKKVRVWWGQFLLMGEETRMA